MNMNGMRTRIVNLKYSPPNRKRVQDFVYVADIQRLEERGWVTFWRLRHKFPDALIDHVRSIYPDVEVEESKV